MGLLDGVLSPIDGDGVMVMMMNLEVSDRPSYPNNGDNLLNVGVYFYLSITV
jgi:hypothetical protein